MSSKQTPEGDEQDLIYQKLAGADSMNGVWIDCSKKDYDNEHPFNRRIYTPKAEGDKVEGNQEIGKQIIKILKENIHFVPQIEGYTFHGAVEKIIELFKEWHNKLCASGEEHCVAGCKRFTGNETKHHPACQFYPNSLSEQMDKLMASGDDIWECGYDAGWLEEETHSGEHRDDNFNAKPKKEYFKDKFGIDIDTYKSEVGEEKSQDEDQKELLEELAELFRDCYLKQIDEIKAAQSKYIIKRKP